MTQYICDTYGYTVYTSNYQLPLYNCRPAPVEDCVAFNREMLKTWDASQIIVTGESAGCTLALSLPCQLQREGIEPPREIISCSPCSNQALSFPSIDGNGH